MMPDRSLPQEPRSRPWIWGVYVLLFAASVPWYLPAGSPPRIWLGLPHWVVISLAAYLAVAVFTAWVVARYWPAAGGDDAAPIEIAHAATGNADPPNDAPPNADPPNDAPPNADPPNDAPPNVAVSDDARAAGDAA